MNKDYEVIRAELWKEIAVAYVGADNSTNCTGAVNWADKILKEFDERFKERFDEDLV